MPISFPASFPLGFADGYTPAVANVGGSTLAWIESHCELGKDLLLEQFKAKPRIEALLCALLVGVQELDDATWQVLIGRWIDNAVGVQLDRIGEIVNLGRIGWADDAYRAFLRARILVLRSSGTWPDIGRVLVALGTDLSLAQYDEPDIAALRVIAGEGYADVELIDVWRVLNGAKAAGVKLYFEAPLEQASTTFTYGTTPLSQDNALGYADVDADPAGGAYAGGFSA